MRIKARYRFYLLFVAFMGASQIMYAKVISDKDILMVAAKGLQGYLEKIPVNDIGAYGFKAPSEYRLIKLGKPIRMKTFNELADGKKNAGSSTYIVSTNEWRVPLVVNGEYRAFLSVAGDNVHSLSCVDFGAAVLAKEIGNMISSQKIKNCAILRMYTLRCDMVILDSDKIQADYELIPLQSALYLVSGNSFKKNMRVSLNSLLPAIKEQAIKNKQLPINR